MALTAANAYAGFGAKFGYIGDGDVVGYTEEENKAFLSTAYKGVKATGTDKKPILKSDFRGKENKKIWFSDRVGFATYPEEGKNQNADCELNIKEDVKLEVNSRANFEYPFTKSEFDIYVKSLPYLKLGWVDSDMVKDFNNLAPEIQESLKKLRKKEIAKLQEGELSFKDKKGSLYLVAQTKKPIDSESEKNVTNNNSMPSSASIAPSKPTISNAPTPWLTGDWAILAESRAFHSQTKGFSNTPDNSQKEQEESTETSPQYAPNSHADLDFRNLDCNDVLGLLSLSINYIKKLIITSPGSQSEANKIAEELINNKRRTLGTLIIYLPMSFLTRGSVDLSKEVGFGYLQETFKDAAKTVEIVLDENK